MYYPMLKHVIDQMCIRRTPLSVLGASGSPSWAQALVSPRMSLKKIPSTYQGRRSGQESGGGTDWFVNQRFAAGGLGGAVSPLEGSGAEARKQTHFCKNILKMNLKSGLISVARHAVRDCEKVVDIWMLGIENDRLIRPITGVTN